MAVEIEAAIDEWSDGHVLAYQNITELTADDVICIGCEIDNLGHREADRLSVSLHDCSVSNIENCSIDEMSGESKVKEVFNSNIEKMGRESAIESAASVSFTELSGRVSDLTLSSVARLDGTVSRAEKCFDINELTARGVIGNIKDSEIARCAGTIGEMNEVKLNSLEKSGSVVKMIDSEIENNRGEITSFDRTSTIGENRGVVKYCHGTIERSNGGVIGNKFDESSVPKSGVIIQNKLEPGKILNREALEVYNKRQDIQDIVAAPSNEKTKEKPLSE